MLLTKKPHCFGQREITSQEPADENVPGSEEIKTQCEIIRSGWTPHEKMRRTRHARYFYEWLLLQTEGTYYACAFLFKQIVGRDFIESTGQRGTRLNPKYRPVKSRNTRKARKEEKDRRNLKGGNWPVLAWNFRTQAATDVAQWRELVLALQQHCGFVQGMPQKWSRKNPGWQ